MEQHGLMRRNYGGAYIVNPPGGAHKDETDTAGSSASCIATEAALRIGDGNTAYLEQGTFDQAFAVAINDVHRAGAGSVPGALISP